MHHLMMMRWCALMVAILTAGCAVSHAGLKECDPGSGEPCTVGEVCAATPDGMYACMGVCDRFTMNLCLTGEACLTAPEGFVCWVGGPVVQGAACEHHLDCVRGLRCNRDGVCEQVCETVDVDCDTARLRCEYGVCQLPVGPGSPCARPVDCSPLLSCLAVDSFTCQESCQRELCTSGASCGDRSDCLTGPVSRDSCEIEGSVGCRLGEVCRRTPVGVLRCMRTGCEPHGSLAPCSAAECLPDPEEPENNICWIGGATAFGAPCADSYECSRGQACNAAGVCSYACTTEGAPCPTLEAHVCRDFVCTPEDAG